MYRIAVDPGGTTGIFSALFTPDLPCGTAPLSHQLAPLDAVRYLHDFLARGLVDWLVVEGYQQLPGVRSFQPDALEVIGALRYVCSMYGVPFELQDRSVRKRVSNERLRSLGWWPVGKPHAQDAARHLYAACVRRDATFAEMMSTR